MITYRLLKGTRIEALHEAFLGVFADYQVKMDMPLDRFNEMLIRRGYDENISFGAFNGEQLAGIVLNGLRRRCGEWTAYNLGTGVVPEFRRQGLTSELLRLVASKLRADSISHYLLEVLADNSPAIALYSKHGFHKERVLNCYRKERSENEPESNAWVIREVERFDPEHFKAFRDFVPSWQNDSGAINAIPGIFRYATVFDRDAVVGYAIMTPGSGEIPQMAVHPDYRRRGIGNSLLDWLAGATEAPRISILNVDANCHAANAFLAASGYEVFVVQHEMAWTHF